MTEQPERLFYSSDPARRMSMPEMGNLLFDLTARCVDRNGRFGGETWIWFRLQEAEGLEAIGRFIDRLAPHAKEIATMLRAKEDGQ